MTIKARILTAYRVWEFEVPADWYKELPKEAQLEDAHYRLTDRLYSIEYEGVITMPGRIIDIRRPEDVQAIEVWEDAETDEQQTVDVTVGVDSSQDGPGDMSAPVHYLGQEARIHLLTYRLNGNLFVFPQEINGQPALDLMDHGALGQVVTEYLHRERISAVIVLPPVHIWELKNARAYLKEYAEKTAPAVPFLGEKTAHAAGGLWDDRT